MSRITDVLAWEALDSRGVPTVGCSVTLDDGSRGSAVVPSGASTGQFEAHELRDGDPGRYAGRGVRQAVANTTGELAEAVAGMDAGDWRAVDRRLCQVDGTESLGRLGANAVLGVSLASCVAGAAAARRPLYQHLGDAEDGQVELPLPMVNIISGGAHAAGAIDIQDVLVVPAAAETFAEAIAQAGSVRRGTALEAEARGLATGLVADEGGLGMPLQCNTDAFELVMAGAARAGLTPGVDVWLAVDVAANELRAEGGYRLAVEERVLGPEALADEIARWCADYPILSVEDCHADDDWEGWRAASQRIDGRVQLLGDDLFVTSAERLTRGVAAGIANAILLKPNQAGTLQRTEEALMEARRAGYRTVLSARSGDTEDAWLADVGVAWRTGQIKVGSTMRSERTAKWNRLLAIEAEAAGTARMADPFGAR